MNSYLFGLAIYINSAGISELYEATSRSILSNINERPQRRNTGHA